MGVKGRWREIIGNFERIEFKYGFSIDYDFKGWFYFFSRN